MELLHFIHSYLKLRIYKHINPIKVNLKWEKLRISPYRGQKEYNVATYGYA